MPGSTDDLSKGDRPRRRAAEHLQSCHSMAQWAVDAGRTPHLAAETVGHERGICELRPL
jgi:hypothetical protein